MQRDAPHCLVPVPAVVENRPPVIIHPNAASSEDRMPHFAYPLPFFAYPLPFVHPLAKNNPNVAAANKAHAGRLQSQTRRPLNETKIEKGSSTSKRASICPATCPK